MTATIVIDEAAWTAMTGHAEAGYPDESCGVLLGTSSADGHLITLAAACVNRAGGESRTRFAIDAEQVLDVTLEAREAGLDIIGFYHSHPDKGPFFSERDIQECWPDSANIVLAVDKGRFREARAYIADAGRTRAGVRTAPLHVNSGGSRKTKAP